MRRVKKHAVRYFYISRNDNGALLHGVVYDKDCKQIWKRKGDYDWALRFTSVLIAIQYAAKYGIDHYRVIDIAGRALYDSTDEEAVRMYAQ